MAKRDFTQEVGFLSSSQGSPKYFINKVWGLTAQPPMPEHKELVESYLDAGLFKLIKPHHYGIQQDDGSWKWWEFEKGVHWTWQQNIILTMVERALAGKGKARISICSGHGTGKTATFSWLILWFLFSFYEAQIACTAPTKNQMHDIMWKEVAKWMSRMPDGMKALYEWNSSYIRIKDDPEKWFARAQTASKDKPEALAGVHGDNVLYMVDEASGVIDEVYNVVEGALTEDNAFFFMISNGTRSVGYFYDSHHKDAHEWQTLNLNSSESPVVKPGYAKRMADKHGIESDEYQIRVKGGFPKKDAIDDKGYSALIDRNMMKEPIGDIGLIGPKRLGLDPAGAGKNKSVWVCRDAFQAKIVKELLESDDPKALAMITYNLAKQLGIPAEEVYVDAFGVGTKVIAALYKIGFFVNAVIVGDPLSKLEGYTEDELDMKFLNIRAWISWETKLWMEQGGKLEGCDEGKWDSCLNVRWRRSESDKVQIMPKRDMRKLKLPSPDEWDALTLTFANSEPLQATGNEVVPEELRNYQEEEFDPHALMG